MSAPSLPKRVQAAAIERFIASCLEACGMPGTDARTTAGLMTEADLRGVDGHGIFRLPQYCKRFKTGGLNTKPSIRTISERPGQALIDGDNGMGHLVMKRAADIAIAKARTTGVAWVGARNSNHAGAAALYAQMPLAHDMIGIYVAVGNANHLPPWGGTAMLLSTNPIAIAVPSNSRPPIILDMATTTAAYGKVKLAQQRGEQMPVGWMIDKEGKPLTDPNRASEGFLMPIGGPKGYGLALMFGILAGVLNGAAFGKTTIDFNADQTSPTNTGQFVLALDISAFMDVVEFKRQVDDVWTQMKSSPTMPGFDEVRLPGESSAKTHADRSRNGIPLVPELGKQLQTLAEQLGVTPL